MLKRLMLMIKLMMVLMMKMAVMVMMRMMMWPRCAVISSVSLSVFSLVT